ncbi:MAG: hypothetical protein AABY27_06560 [Pseudomonadota bacterium]
MFKKSFVARFRERFGFTNACNNKALMQAVMNRDLERVVDLLNKGADPNYSDNYHGMVLNVATIIRRHDIMEALLKSGANPNGDPNYVYTYNPDYVFPRLYDIPELPIIQHAPIHIACISYEKGNFGGDLIGVNLLIKYGANVNARNLLGCTPLIQIAFYYDMDPINEKIEKLLIKNGANTKISNSIHKSYDEILCVRELKYNFFYKAKHGYPRKLDDPLYNLNIARKSYLDIDLLPEERNFRNSKWYNKDLINKYYFSIKPIYHPYTFILKNLIWFPTLSSTQKQLPSDIIYYIMSFLDILDIAYISNKDKVNIKETLIRLKKEGYIVQDVAGDGNCFFHALDLQLKKSLGYNNLRAIAIDYMQDHLEEFTPFITDANPVRYINNLSRNGAWVDNIAIAAIANALGVTIDITGVYNTIVTPTVATGDNQVVRLFYTGDHYLSILKNPALEEIQQNNANNLLTFDANLEVLGAM